MLILKEIKDEKKYLKENNNGNKQIVYDFHNYGDKLTPLVNIDYLIAMLTIIDNGIVYCGNETSYIYVINDNSVGVICPIRKAKNSDLAKIFAKRDKEFKYVD